MRLLGRDRGADRFARRRAAMVVHQLRDRGISDPLVLEAMGSVPRERFVPEMLLEDAYADGALAIGNGQTISQPYIVAVMSEALRLPAWIAAHPDRTPRVLDIGTGSGYQAAVLAEMGAQVIGIERDPELAAEARERLADMGVDRVRVEVGDGSLGWAEAAPYDAIVVAAACPEPPEPLLAELADGARLVAPVGDRAFQELTVVLRLGQRLESEVLEACVFVPLVGRYGFPG